MAPLLHDGRELKILNKLIDTPPFIRYHAYRYEKTISSLTALIGFLAASLQAGTETYKQVAHRRRRRQCMDSAFTGRSTWGLMSIKTAAGQTFTVIIRITTFSD